MTGPDWFAGIIGFTIVVAACIMAMWFNPEKENRHK